jgi:hypothetical protein
MWFYIIISEFDLTINIGKLLLYKHIAPYLLFSSGDKKDEDVTRFT